MEYLIKPVKVVQPIALEIVFKTTQEAQDIAFALRIGAEKLKQDSKVDGNPEWNTEMLTRANSLLHLAKYIESIVVD